jgi:glutaminyl-peptide cyclotransferase
MMKSVCLTLSLWFLLSAFSMVHPGYRTVRTYPHDPGAFTQGLIFENGHLYESTGLYGHSSLREVDLQTGRILREYDLPVGYFGEGLTDWGNDLVQVTWTSQIGFIYDRRTFRLLRSFRYSGEGWGLTQDGRNLILSDGTSTLRFLDPRSFRQVRTVTVTDLGMPVTRIDELEYIHGEIYANIWLSNRIARISPNSGRVLGWIDLTGIIPSAELRGTGSVLNGIAWDADGNRIFVTGKLWPKLFEIREIR